MGNLRPVLIIGLIFLGYMIWVQWQKDYGPTPQAPATQAQSASDTLDVPSTPTGVSAAAKDLPEPVEQQEPL
ncbi:MAG: membrane protein insertase YidC, partial [Planctomycetota bacterium]